MNHNFANWELTQLLPEINPYNSTKAIDSMGYEQLVTICESTLSPEQWRYLWTWEDIRLYFKNKNIEIIIDYIKWIKGPYYFRIYNHNIGKIISTKELFSTYEETRIEAIKYCLSLIANEKDRN